MRRITKLAFATIGVLTLTILIIAAVLTAVLAFDAKDSRALLGWAVKQFSGYTVTIQGPLSVDLSLTPSLWAASILIAPPDDTSALKISRIERMRVRIALAPLLHGKIHILNLDIDGATVNWDPWKKTSARKYAVPDAATVRNMTLIIPPRGPMRAVHVLARDLRLQHGHAAHTLLIKGTGALNNAPISVHGLFGMRAGSANPGRPYPVDCVVRMADLEMRIEGTLDDAEQWEGLHLLVEMRARECATLLHMFGIPSGPLGRMHAKARLGGSMTSPGLSDIALAVTGSPRLSLTARGAIPDLKGGDGAFLQVAGACTDQALLQLLSPPGYSLTAIDFKGNVHGTRQGLNVENFQASAVTDQRARIQTRGKINVGAWPYPVSGWVFSLAGNLTSPTVSALVPTGKISPPEMSPVRANFHIMGTAGRFALEDIAVALGNPQSLALSFTGRIGQVEPGGITPLSSVHLSGSLKAVSLAQFRPWVQGKLPDLGPLAARGELKDRRGGYALENIQIVLGQAEAFKVEATGSVDTGRRGKEISLERIALHCRVRGAPPRHIQMLLGLDEPYIDALDALFDLAGPPQALAVSKAHVAMGMAREMLATMDGDIRRINPLALRSINRKDRQGLEGKNPAIAGINLHCTVQASGTRALMRQFGFKKPYIESFTGSFDLTGRPDNLAITKALVEAGMMERGNITLQGSIDHLDVNDLQAVQGVDLRLTGFAPDSGILSRLTGRDLTELGPIVLKASLGDETGALSVEPFEVRAGEAGQEALIIHGHMHDMLNPGKVHVDAAGVASSKLVLVGPPGKPPFPLSGNIKARGFADQIIIEELMVTSAPLDTVFLDVRGNITDLGKAPTFKGTLVSDIQDLALIIPRAGASLTSLGALHADGQIVIKRSDMAFKGTMNLGRNTSRVDLSASSAAKRPRIVATIHAPTIALDDGAAAPQAPATSRAPAQPPFKPAGKRFFDMAPLPIDIPQTIDATIHMTADTLIDRTGTGVFHDVRLDASLEKGGLRLSPMTFRCAGGAVALDVSIEPTGEAPHMRMRLTAEDLDIAMLEEYLHKPHVLDGKLSVSADMHARGDSAHALASSLEGDIGFAIEKGAINREVELLAADGVDMMLYFTESITGDALDLVLPLAKRKKQTALNCLVARFAFQQGVGLSRIIAYDTSDYKVSGVGTLNLADETMQLVLQPKSKKKLYDWSSSPIYISGPISKPALRKIPYREAAGLSAEIFAPYVFLPARGLGYLWYLLNKDAGKDSACAGLDLGDR